jgi:uncharacterized membrane protein YkvA (DUF1232 family)
VNYSHLKILLKDSGFSPEQLGSRIGMSGMTLRRWSELPAEDKVPELYEKAFHEVVYELLAEGILPKESEIVPVVLKESEGSIFSAAIKNLGFTDEFLKNAKPDTESMVSGLSQIGASQGKQESVTKSKNRIFSYSKLGADWKYRIKTLYEVTKSKEITKLDKFAAYGALFYLLTPFDLIPDHIPVFGLMDDFFVLGIVTVYYVNRFPKLFKKQEE